VNASSADKPLRRLLALEEGLAVPEVDGLAGSPVWLEAPAGWRAYARLAEDGDGQGCEVQRFTAPGAHVVSVRVSDDGEVALPFDLDEAAFNFLSESWRAGAKMPRLSEGQLALFYRVKRAIPRGAQLAARRLLMRRQARLQFPRWPFEESLLMLMKLYALVALLSSGLEVARFRWFWPRTYNAALILTHDVESEEGLRLATEIADLEEELGFRSSFNIVGKGYPIDRGVVEDLRRRGFELGVHGIVHDRSLFSSRAEFEAQAPQLAEVAHELGARGFRSPATHRRYEWLSELPFEYDCTMPHVDPFEPQPGGCFSLWPFFVGDVVELPYTVPHDLTTFKLLGRTAETWTRQADRIIGAAGLVQVVSHPDPGYLGDPEMRQFYREFLEAMQESSSVWHALPHEVAAWWRQRDSGGHGPWEMAEAEVTAEGTVDSVHFHPPSAGRRSAVPTPSPVP